MIHDFEVYKAMALSTAHLTEEDNEALHYRAQVVRTMVTEREYGYLMKLCMDEAMDVDEAYSPALNGVIQFAIKEGFQLIEFDRDAPVSEQFQQFEW
jgi:hypothetical protein